MSSIALVSLVFQYYFEEIIDIFVGIVDVESIMARIEDSKESMRNSSIVDADGANEVQAVSLTPKNW